MFYSICVGKLVYWSHAAYAQVSVGYFIHFFAVKLHSRHSTFAIDRLELQYRERPLLRLPILYSNDRSILRPKFVIKIHGFFAMSFFLENPLMWKAVDDQVKSTDFLNISHFEVSS